MDIKKLFVGGIAGGIAYFFLGWLIYGMLLMNFMASHQGIIGGIQRAEPDFLYLIIGNLALGFLITFIFIKGAVNSLGSGLVTGGIVGLLMVIGYDCMIYGTTNIMSKTAMAVDVAAMTVMSAIVGAIVGMVLGMGKKTG